MPLPPPSSPETPSCPHPPHPPPEHQGGGRIDRGRVHAARLLASSICPS
ncbi:hypothetical protein Zm00014a_028270 [Zea mays]|uniref:Uncharacterized protein n=1 Tax=Zea mays TaxID=4577 RepID=A0A3L6F3L1_MAIZE|nr:hypothetical protein Zm00014a_028270 [Zea mays]